MPAFAGMTGSLSGIRVIRAATVRERFHGSDGVTLPYGRGSEINLILFLQSRDHYGRFHRYDGGYIYIRVDRANKLGEKMDYPLTITPPLGCKICPLI